MTDTPTTADTLEAFGATYLRLHQALDNASESQWQAGYTPRARDDGDAATIRSNGTTSDPTVGIFLDGRRLALREAVIEAERAQELALHTMQTAIAKLEGLTADERP
ncbi:hypothetical protein V8Z69_18345 [Microbacterium aurugineum]|uniref:DUF7169 domain-containing protein n=1 Tax=Microbacterium aurugineum TaxID=2851642 RepID=UPI0039BE005C